ncbi:glycosyltransferase family 39 protein [Paracoccaceae bacterium]|nr:glycosyltransferase family 39 protein [Paracoccaceae bacterium]
MKGNAYNQTHLLVFLFVIFCFVKLAIIKHIPLINDEAYTLTISRHLSLSYLDHPPLMMWLSYFLHQFAIIESYVFRIPYIAFGILTSFFLFKIGSIIYSKEAGIVSAILYFISPFFFLSGGLFIVPDASLNFSVAGATYIAIRLIFRNEENTFLWLSLGLLLSIAFLSKYQAYLFGTALFMAFFIWKRNMLFTKKFNISLLTAVIGLVPVLLWNIENNFESFAFHGNRSSFTFDFQHIFNSLFAQLFFLLPTTGVLIFLSLNKKLIKKHEKFLILLSLPTIIIFNILILLSDNSFSHWSMVGWMLLIPIASNHLILMKSFKPQLLSLKVFSILATVILISSIITHAKTGFITRNYGEKIPGWDDTRELLDWGLIANVLAKNLQNNELNSIATLNWYDSGQLAAAFNFKYSVGVIGPNSNHFKYINLKDKNFTTLIDVRLIHSKEHFELKQVTLDHGYNIINKTELPFFRGSQKYGIINILFVDKIN